MAFQTWCLQLPMKALHLYPSGALAKGDPNTVIPELSEIARGTSGVPTGYCINVECNAAIAKIRSRSTVNAKENKLL